MPYPPLCERGIVVRSGRHKKTADFPPLSADLISLRKPHGPPCRIVVNRDSFRELGFGVVLRNMGE